MVNHNPPISSAHASFATHGWSGLGLIAVFWPLSWFLTGPRTFWCFFPLWLGYNLTVDALVLWRRGTSLFTRDWRKYIGLFLASMPAWWLFEFMNWRTQNWHYLGGHLVSGLTYVVVASINFSIVVPAVFGTAELMASFGFVQRMGCGPVIRPDRRTTTIFFVAGLVMLALLMARPLYFFPFVWLSAYFILEPINIWLGNRSLASWVGVGDWRPVVALWLGALTCGFFWEMWNFLSYPKWVYVVPWVDYLHVFEMPLLGYGGYLPFALELYALYHLVVGLLGHKATDYVRVAPDNNRPVPWPWEPERSTPTSARSCVGGFCLDSQGRAGRSRIGANTRLASPYHSRVTAPESMFFGMADARLAHIISIPILHTSPAAIQNTLVALQRPTSYGTIAAGLPAG